MTRPPSVRTRCHGERGAISWVTLLLLVVLAAGGYAGWAWAPVYVDHYAVKQVVREYANRAVRNLDDRELVREMCKKIALIRQVEGVDDQGRPTRAPAVDVEPEDVTWERDTAASPPTIHVAFSYVRRVTLPGVDRVVEKTFTIDSTSEIDIPRW